MKQKNLGIFTPIMIGIATIVILTMVIFRITGKTAEQEYDNNYGAGCNETVKTACGAGYDNTIALETTAADTVDWVDIMVIAIVGFAVIGYFAFGRR